MPCPHEKIEDEKCTENTSHLNPCSNLNFDTETNKCYTNADGKIIKDANVCDEAKYDSKKIHDCPDFLQKGLQTLNEKVNVNVLCLNKYF